MKTLSFLLAFASAVFAQDTTQVMRIANTINVDGLRFAESDSTVYLRIYFVGDSIKADYDRMKPDRAIREFFQFVGSSRYLTASNFFVGDTVAVCANCPSENAPYWIKGVIVRESVSGRLLIKRMDYADLRKQWFDSKFVEAYIP